MANSGSKKSGSTFTPASMRSSTSRSTRQRRRASRSWL